MPRQEEIAQQQDLLTTHRRTLAQELQRAAKYGGEQFAPPEVANGIYEARSSIKRIKDILRIWGEKPEDLPDDEQVSLKELRSPQQSFSSSLLELAPTVTRADGPMEQHVPTSSSFSISQPIQYALIGLVAIVAVTVVIALIFATQPSITVNNSPSSIPVGTTAILSDVPTESATDPIDAPTINKYMVVQGNFPQTMYWKYPDKYKKIYIDIDNDDIKETIVATMQSQVENMDAYFVKDSIEIRLPDQVDAATHDASDPEKPVAIDLCQISLADVTHDGIPEILIAWDDVNGDSYMNIWQFDQKAWYSSPRGTIPEGSLNLIDTLISSSSVGNILTHADFDQAKFAITSKGIIIVPIGGQGIFKTFDWNGKDFTIDEGSS